MNILTGNGTNNFIIEYNENRPEDKPEEASEEITNS
jgi:hypothetical protein